MKDRSIIDKIGLIEDPLQRKKPKGEEEVIARYPAVALALVENSMGIQGVEALIADIHTTHISPADATSITPDVLRRHLMIDSSWISGFMYMAVLERVDHALDKHPSLEEFDNDIFKAVGHLSFNNRIRDRIGVKYKENAIADFGKILGLGYLLSKINTGNKNYNRLIEMDAETNGTTSIITRDTLERYENAILETFGELAPIIFQQDDVLTIAGLGGFAHNMGVKQYNIQSIGQERNGAPDA
tara:strand:- start:10699 stop:11427 length:729 start_codon:yes stop_codon:yes gene_type:complete